MGPGRKEDLAAGKKSFKHATNRRHLRMHLEVSCCEKVGGQLIVGLLLESPEVLIFPHHLLPVSATTIVNYMKDLSGYSELL